VLVAVLAALPPSPASLFTLFDELASPPFPVSPDSTLPVVFEAPEVAEDDELELEVTPPELPLSPESPEFAFELTVAFPPLPVLPVSPEELFPSPSDAALPESPDSPEFPPVADPLLEALPVSPVSVSPVVALVLFDELELALPVSPPVVVPFAELLPLFPPVASDEFPFAVASPPLPADATWSLPLLPQLLHQPLPVF
jgi:hypothetical protein